MARITRKGDPTTIIIPATAKIILSEVIRRDANNEPIEVRIITDE